MNAARWAEQELGAQIKVVKKSSSEYASEKDPPPCPSVMVNGKFIAKNDTVTVDALRDALESGCESGNAGSNSGSSA